MPRLRFPEFRDGGAWELKKLGDKDVSTFVKKRVSVNELVLDSYVSTENILPDFDGIKDATKLPPSGSFTSYKTGDILIANIRPYLKKVWVADRNGAASNDVIVVRPTEEVKKSFLSSLLKNDFFIDYVMKGAKGVKMPRGDVSLMKEYSLAVPGPEEQQKIADCLSSLDKLIAAQTEKLDALKTHKKGLMQQLFPREGETVPRLRFPEFRGAGEWEVKKLIDTADKNIKWSFIGGPFGSNLKSSDYVDNGVRIIQLQNISDAEFIDSYKIFTSPQKADELLSNNIYPGDIILSKMGDPVGRACLIPDFHNRYVMCSDGIRLVVDEKLHNKYFIYLLINSIQFRSLVEKTATGSTRKRIGLDELKNLPMLLPKISEQQKIADGLSSLDALIAAQTDKIDALKAHKKGLMQQLFPSPEAVDA